MQASSPYTGGVVGVRLSRGLSTPEPWSEHNILWWKDAWPWWNHKM